MLIVWGVCFLFWITSDAWQRCLNVKHNYEEIGTIDEDENDAIRDNPFKSSDSGSDYDDITYDGNTLKTNNQNPIKLKNLV